MERTKKFSDLKERGELVCIEISTVTADGATAEILCLEQEMDAISPVLRQDRPGDSAIPAAVTPAGIPADVFLTAGLDVM